MSKRHRSPEEVERPAKRERRWSNHRERQAVRASLGSVDDPDELVVPVLPHDRPHAAGVAGTPRKRPRHWKLKDWKRRTNQRRERARAVQDLAKRP